MFVFPEIIYKKCSTSNYNEKETEIRLVTLNKWLWSLVFSNFYFFYLMYKSSMKSNDYRNFKDGIH